MADTARTPGDPFTFPFAPHTHLPRAAAHAARRLLSAVIGGSSLPLLYRRARSLEGDTFAARALEALGVRVQVEAVDGTIVPASGPLIVAANHPTGALDGLAVAEAIRQVRPDVRLLANHLLASVPELREGCFFVDPFGGPEAAARSMEGLRAAHLWLRAGGSLVMFPAGEVAWQRGSGGRYVDSPWSATLGRLARATRAAVLPVYVAGRNSRAFYAAGAIHPRLRTVLLPRQLLRQRGTVARVRIGSPIAAETIVTYTSAAAATARIRGQVDDLSALCPACGPEAMAGAIDPGLLERDVNALTAPARLLSSGVYDVFCAEAAELPHVLPEIGRLRELTFRATGEGTGRALDLDPFDRHYQHLFVWNRERREVVGAYRAARIDTVLADRGVAGLYTRSLFRYDERLLRRLSPGFELGRSFVRAEYQRNYNALLLLWRGIGQMIVRAPECRYLFGPVSISARYQDTSQQMLCAYLAQNHYDRELAELVRAVNPPALLPPERGAAAAANVEALDALVRRIEQHQGVPVLLRQYLRLHATLLGFNVDPAFGDALDALMVVDLTKLPLASLQRYLGREEAADFLARHAAAISPVAA
jgi:putative hemolysin